MYIAGLVYFKAYTLYMVHLIVLQNKSAELVVSLARKRKRDHFKPIACADRETRKQPRKI